MGTPEKTLADKKRAILIKNAYLGLEKVENCHKVKSQKMKDGVMLNILVRQYGRERYAVSLNTYRAQQALTAKHESMRSRTDLDLARVAGDRNKMNQLLEEFNSKRSVNLAGPSAVEELLFQQILDSRREDIISMRKPENYSKRNDTKGFWEEDEEFYKTFDGAIRNPFQVIDVMMEKYGNQQSRESSVHSNDKNHFSRRMKSLRAVEKISFTKQRKTADVRIGTFSPRGKSAIPAVDIHFKNLVETHKRTSTDLSLELEDRKQRLFLGTKKLALDREKDDSKILRALEKYEKSQRLAADSTLSDKPITAEQASASIKTQKEWRSVFTASHIPSLTWKPVAKHNQIQISTT